MNNNYINLIEEIANCPYIVEDSAKLYHSKLRELSERIMVDVIYVGVFHSFSAWEFKYSVYDRRQEEIYDCEYDILEWGEVVNRKNLEEEGESANSYESFEELIRMFRKNSYILTRDEYYSNWQV